MGNTHNTTKPILISNLPERNRFFTGREDVLNQLTNLLKSNREVAIKQAISGLGGIGKTQTAIEFCYRHIDDYQTILWVKTEHETDINNSYLEIAKLLGLIPKTNAAFESLKIEDIIYLVKGWLINNSNWLMVLDNLEDPSLVKQYLPNNHNGHILITTRSNALKGYAEIVNLKKMSIDTGTLFLLKRANLITITNADKTNKKDKSLDELLSNISEKDKLVAQEIVKELDGLPLALEQAGAYIYETQCSLSDYLAAYKDLRNTIPILDNDGEDANDHKSVFTTFKLAFDKVKETNSVAADLLKVCSMLSPELIPEEIFIDAGDLLGDELAKLKGNIIEFNKVIKTLLNYSLVERDTNNKSISIHRLVQAVIRELMDNSSKKIWFENLVNALEYLRPSDVKDPKSWPKYQRLLPSASALFEIDSSYVFLVSKAATLFNEFGFYCDNQAFYAQSLSLYNQSLAIDKHHFGDNHPDVALIINNIAVIYRKQGNHNQALEYYNQALNICKEHLGNSHILVGDIINNVAIVYSDQQHHNQALEYYQQALGIYKQNLTDSHHSIAGTLNNIGLVYFNQGNYPEALDYYQQALSIKKQHLGEFHPSVAGSLSNIASVYINQNNYQEGENNYKKALKIYEQVLGKNHPDTAIVLFNLGNLYANTSKEQEAINHYRETLSIFDQFLPSNHPYTVAVLEVYSDLLLKLNRSDEAHFLVERLSFLEKPSE